MLNYLLKGSIVWLSLGWKILLSAQQNMSWITEFIYFLKMLKYYMYQISCKSQNTC